MKQRLMERMFDLIAKRALTANDEERAELTKKIQEIQDTLKGM